MRRAVLEKLPLFALSAVVMVVTYGTQQADGTMRDLATISLLDRIGNASLSYVGYLEHAFWPVSLSVFYPYRETLGLAAVSAAVGLLVATLASLALWRRAPYLAVGWLWFLGTLMPVIGLVQVGEQAMANRYAYLPLIGPSAALAWTASAAAERRSWHRAVAALAVVADAGHDVSRASGGRSLARRDRAVSSRPRGRSREPHRAGEPGDRPDPRRGSGRGRRRAGAGLWPPGKRHGGARGGT